MSGLDPECWTEMMQSKVADMNASLTFIDINIYNSRLYNRAVISNNKVFYSEPRFSFPADFQVKPNKNPFLADSGPYFDCFNSIRNTFAHFFIS